MKNNIIKLDLNYINTGDCMLESANTWLAINIQKFQKNKFNHAGMFWWCYDELMVIEADKRGIAITPFEKVYMNGSCYKTIIGLRPKFGVDGTEYGKYMLPYAGHTRYDFFNLLIAQSIKYLTFGRVWLGETKQSEKKFICGEFCAHVYNHFNKGMFLEEQKIAPADLFNSFMFEHYTIKQS